ncbi:altronate dehydratase [Ancylobacter dichloromethanicus]|uniref:Dehydratase n=1 Tax=Ancylobacter dichloromethanicus TaxID=518825 RepID=A0A9W6JAS3_9HYPH|nr:altronate dehydratase family protein [Ancylobacter dichloromethanicus]MBS7555881.1 altronate dehydratase [Ancylobacter dichloromethanicus]GLK72424.1 dehydratase [Ancylobacter dichloromethanicus]
MSDLSPFTRAAEPRTIVLDAADNVVVAVEAIEPGSQVAGVVARERIPRGHKMARSRIVSGQPLVKFGQPIGVALADIAPGDWVHVHNVSATALPQDGSGLPALAASGSLAAGIPSTFQGYRRSDGRTGTRNYIGILTSVNCAASVARFAADAITRSGVLDAYPGIDGVVPIIHGTGCGLAERGEGFDVLRRTQWGYACHPNFAAVIMVGLGCEVLQIARMKQQFGVEESDGFRTLTIQETGGTRRTVDQIVGTVREMLPRAAAARRETRPVSELVLGLQCGGSDGYSALTANPALGFASDLLVHDGGTSILSETPEIYGAEHLLMRRACDPGVGERLMERLRWWEDYTGRNGAEMNNNPSPGNKAGGLSTILEKSLGAVAKSGHAALQAVYEYAEPVRAHGLVFMDTPGFDPVSATGQVAGGANIICFTTGRGSAFGCKPAPSLKLATNSEMYRRMTDDMDINCGDMLEGVSLETKGREIFDALLRVASGERTRSEYLGYGDSEFVPWQIGAVM